MRVCLDNHILIWGVRGEFSEGQHDMVPRAQALLEELENQRATIIVPAPVITEYLLGVDPERHPDTIEKLSRRFSIAPYDTAAALRSTDLWLRRNGGRTLSSELKALANGASRQVLKIDCQIVGIALAKRADVIYSHDPGIRSFAEGVVKVSDVPIYDGYVQTRLQVAE